jgi:hypothetical protein
MITATGVIAVIAVTGATAVIAVTGATAAIDATATAVIVRADRDHEAKTTVPTRGRTTPRRGRPSTEPVPAPAGDRRTAMRLILPPLLLAMLSIIDANADDAERRQFIRSWEQTRRQLAESRQNYDRLLTQAGLTTPAVIAGLADKITEVEDGIQRILDAGGNDLNDAHRLLNYLNTIQSGFWQLNNPLENLVNRASNSGYDLSAEQPIMLAYQHTQLRLHARMVAAYAKMLQNPDRGMNGDELADRLSNSYDAVMQAVGQLHRCREDYADHERRDEFIPPFEAIVVRLIDRLLTDIRKLETGIPLNEISMANARTTFLWPRYNLIGEAMNRENLRSSIASDEISQRLWGIYLETANAEQTCVDRITENCLSENLVIDGEDANHDRQEMNLLSQRKYAVQNALNSCRNFKSNLESFDNEIKESSSNDVPDTLRERRKAIDQQFAASITGIPEQPGVDQDAAIDQANVLIQTLAAESQILNEELRLERMLGPKIREVEQRGPLGDAAIAVAAARQGFARYAEHQRRQHFLQAEMGRLQRELQQTYEQQNDIWQEHNNGPQKAIEALDRRLKELAQPAPPPAAPPADPAPAAIEPVEGDLPPVNVQP